MKRNFLVKNLCVNLFIILFVLSINSLSAQNQLAQIKQSGELRVGLTGTQPPYSMVAKDTSIIGYEVDIAQIIADRMGVKLVKVQLKFAELLDSLKSGNIDLIMSGMTMNTERNMEVAFIGPYHSSGKSILTFAQVYADAKSASELNKGSVKIATLKGSTSEAYVKENMPKAKLISTDNYDEGIALLNKDKVSLLLSENPIIRYTMLLYPDNGYVTLEEPFNYEPIGIGVMPNDILFLNLLQNIVSELEENGSLEDLESNWFWDDNWIDQVN